MEARKKYDALNDVLRSMLSKQQYNVLIYWVLTSLLTCYLILSVFRLHTLIQNWRSCSGFCFFFCWSSSLACSTLKENEIEQTATGTHARTRVKYSETDSRPKRRGILNFPLWTLSQMRENLSYLKHRNEIQLRNTWIKECGGNVRRSDLKECFLFLYIYIYIDILQPQEK